MGAAAASSATVMEVAGYIEKIGAGEWYTTYANSTREHAIDGVFLNECTEEDVDNIISNVITSSHEAHSSLHQKILKSHFKRNFTRREVSTHPSNDFGSLTPPALPSASSVAFCSHENPPAVANSYTSNPAAWDTDSSPEVIRSSNKYSVPRYGSMAYGSLHNSFHIAKKKEPINGNKVDSSESKHDSKWVSPFNLKKRNISHLQGTRSSIEAPAIMCSDAATLNDNISKSEAAVISNLDISSGEHDNDNCHDQSTTVASKRDKNRKAAYTDIEYPNGDHYQGFCRAGTQIKHGKGTMRYHNRSIYIGDWTDDLEWGTGSCTFSDGDRYVGNWYRQKPHGRGVFYWSCGDKYEGIYNMGKRNGLGVFSFKKGDVYSGEFKNDAMTGEGEWKFLNGEVYKGHFKDGKFSGVGILRCPDGSSSSGEWAFGKLNGRGSFESSELTYHGEFKNSQYHGHGVLNDNGDIYEGEFKNGNKWGFGKKRWANGDRYEGNFKNDLLCGTGVYCWKDGEEYSGEFRDGQSHGNGTHRYKNKDVYVGSFKNEMRSGHGVLTCAEGHVLSGIWENDALVSPSNDSSTARQTDGHMNDNQPIDEIDALVSPSNDSSTARQTDGHMNDNQPIDEIDNFLFSESNWPR